ncbi:MAG TPA: DsrE/DsrF/DrsH-like family protein [Candidatus Limnocylindrales bacterium]|nr:DsrE/DsrF/DrsH-like family protein [Candidatus Limnocylindrales bacterium]
MTTPTLERATETIPVDPLASVLAEVEAIPEPDSDDAAKTKSIVIVSVSGEFDKVLPVMILASSAAASDVKCRVFISFWSLLAFVRDDRRIVGDNWMQKMLSLMQRPGIDHRKLSKMNFFGMGPWMMRKLMKQHNVASPRELLEAAQLMGVEFMPCQMTMDMFGLKPEDMIDGLGEPVGAATVIELITNGDGALFI